MEREDELTTAGGAANPAAAGGAANPAAAGGAAHGAGSGTEHRLAELRALGATDAGRARDEAWVWINELGREARRDRVRALEVLGALFASGAEPSNLDGRTEGRLVSWAAGRLADRGLGVVTDLWLPWKGKRFDAEVARGDNLMQGAVRLLGRVVWPFYRYKRVGDGVAGFEFNTWREKGKLDPSTDVMVIDYDSVTSNPRLVIRSIRDELVEVVPGANLGKMLWRRGRGERARYTLLAYFALKGSIEE